MVPKANCFELVAFATNMLGHSKNICSTATRSKNIAKFQTLDYYGQECSEIMLIGEKTHKLTNKGE
jgi:hypothetical protein